MTSEYRRAQVFVQGNFAGILCETEDGYEFAYDTEYLNSSNALPVSITLPLSDVRFRSTTLFPFFDGLIPEGWLLEIVKHNWKISANDRFGLLLVTCRDCIGDVYIRSEEHI